MVEDVIHAGLGKTRVVAQGLLARIGVRRGRGASGLKTLVIHDSHVGEGDGSHRPLPIPFSVHDVVTSVFLLRRPVTVSTPNSETGLKGGAKGVIG